ncbi:MAG: phosphatidylserine decarboxylase [Desulfobulbaceae bacterium BRH_c16a]|nr:MAG: phosphatidylserine decarboxylase [Desulfobulbaceae bacterium BRH_c16a]
MLKPQVPVTQEGYPFIFFSAFCTLLAAIFGMGVLAGILLVVTFFILCFFRDPERFVTDLENAVVSPADGKIILVEKVTDSKFTDAEVQKISIFMNVFDVHVNRVPASGKVEKILYLPGKFYSADSARGALQNEYCATVISTPQGKKLAFVQVAGLIARRIVCWLEPGDSVIRGRRFGLIRFGSRVDLYLPLDTEIMVRPGQKVRSGETIIGHLR